MTNIILRGCNGKMGQVISELVDVDDNAVIVAGIDVLLNKPNKYPVSQSFTKCNVSGEVIIDFSAPVNLEEMLQLAFKRNIGIVLCTHAFSMDQIV